MWCCHTLSVYLWIYTLFIYIFYLFCVMYTAMHADWWLEPDKRLRLKWKRKPTYHKLKHHHTVNVNAVCCCFSSSFHFSHFAFPFNHDFIAIGTLCDCPYALSNYQTQRSFYWCTFFQSPDLDTIIRALRNRFNRNNLTCVFAQVKLYHQTIIHVSIGMLIDEELMGITYVQHISRFTKYRTTCVLKPHTFKAKSY